MQESIAESLDRIATAMNKIAELINDPLASQEKIEALLQFNANLQVVSSELIHCLESNLEHDADFFTRLARISADHIDSL